MNLILHIGLKKQGPLPCRAGCTKTKITYQIKVCFSAMSSVSPTIANS